LGKLEQIDWIKLESNIVLYNTAVSCGDATFQLTHRRDSPHLHLNIKLFCFRHT